MLVFGIGGGSVLVRVSDGVGVLEDDAGASEVSLGCPATSGAAGVEVWSRSSAPLAGGGGYVYTGEGACARYQVWQLKRRVTYLLPGDLF